jgi:hypothetical protein
MIQSGNDHVNVTSETIMVPDKMVGLIIGRGGEQITRLQVRFPIFSATIDVRFFQA